MKKHLFSTVLLLSALLFLLVACGGGEETQESSEPAATEAPVQPTDAPAPTETAVPAPTQPPATSNESPGSEFTNAFDRATTMMAQNSKPTPIPFGGSGGKEDTSDTPTQPTNTPLPPPTPIPQDSNLVGIEVDNLTSTSVCFAYITTPDDDTWGEDQLGSEEIIEAGYYRVFEVTPGTYDIRLDDCYGKVIDAQYGLEVSDITVIELFDAEVPQGGNGSITMINDLESDTCYVYISPSTSDDWGNDWLGTGVVVPTEYQYVFTMKPGQYDMTALDCNFETMSEVYQVDITESGYIWSLSGKEVSTVASLEVINNGDVPICYLQISLNTATEWGPDWLGSEEVIDVGNSRQFEMEPNTYDILASDCDQETIKEEYGINIQDNTTWSIP